MNESTGKNSLDSARPLISIVTIVRNNVSGIAATMDSVLGQTFKDREYIMVDGGSTDGTVELIKARANELSWWYSEPDRGIAHAFNKGIAAAHGEWITFMNAGDVYTSLTTLDEIFGNTGIDVSGVSLITGYESNPAKNFRYPVSPRLTSMHLFERARLAHQATFLRRSLFSHYGSFCEKLSITTDYEFHLRLLRSEPFIFIEKDICLYDISGASTRQYVRAGIQTVRAQLMHVRNPIDAFMILFLACKFMVQKFIFKKNLQAHREMHL